MTEKNQSQLTREHWLVFGCRKQRYENEKREITWDIIHDGTADSVEEAVLYAKMEHEWSFCKGYPRYLQRKDKPDNYDVNAKFWNDFNRYSFQAAYGLSDKELEVDTKNVEKSRDIAEDRKEEVKQCKKLSILKSGVRAAVLKKMLSRINPVTNASPIP